MRYQKEFAKLISHAWHDEQFKKELLQNPQKILTEYGIPVPTGKEIKVCEDSKKMIHFVIPEKPSKELSEQELESLVGGSATISVNFCDQGP